MSEILCVRHSSPVKACGDCYEQLEEKLRLAEECLKRIHEVESSNPDLLSYPASIMTRWAKEALLKLLGETHG